MQAARLLALMALAGVPLGGCNAPLLAAGSVGVVEALSVTSTKKTLEDHVISGVTGEDCSLVQLTETGRYCVKPMYVDRSNLYCYRTLADVSCHYLPDPYKNGQTALASPPPVLKPEASRGWFD